MMVDNIYMVIFYRSVILPSVTCIRACSTEEICLQYFPEILEILRFSRKYSHVEPSYTSCIFPVYLIMYIYTFIYTFIFCRKHQNEPLYATYTTNSIKETYLRDLKNVQKKCFLCTASSYWIMNE